MRRFRCWHSHDAGVLSPLLQQWSPSISCTNKRGPYRCRDSLCLAMRVFVSTSQPLPNMFESTWSQASCTLCIQQPCRVTYGDTPFRQNYLYVVTEALTQDIQRQSCHHSPPSKREGIEKQGKDRSSIHNLRAGMTPQHLHESALGQETNPA